MHRIRSAALLLLAIAFLPACDDDAAGPEDPAGAVVGEWRVGEAYGASALTTSADGVTTDWLSMGAVVELELRADGTTAGFLFAPGADEDGGDFHADLAGTWEIRDGRVYFAHEADTFVRDMSFTLSGGTLHGDRSFGSVRVVLTLVRR